MCSEFRIGGLGGTAPPGSSTERALSVALRAAESAGATVGHYGSAFLTGLPHYQKAPPAEAASAEAILASGRQAHGVLIASPGRHGSVSGLVKKAIDDLDETAGDARPHLGGLPVGLIATAYGWQGAGTTLSTLRVDRPRTSGLADAARCGRQLPGRDLRRRNLPRRAGAPPVGGVGREVAGFAHRRQRTGVIGFQGRHAEALRRAREGRTT